MVRTEETQPEKVIPAASLGDRDKGSIFAGLSDSSTEGIQWNPFKFSQTSFIRRVFKFFHWDQGGVAALCVVHLVPHFILIPRFQTTSIVQMKCWEDSCFFRPPSTCHCDQNFLARRRRTWSQVGTLGEMSEWKWQFPFRDCPWLAWNPS